MKNLLAAVFLFVAALTLGCAGSGRDEWKDYHANTVKNMDISIKASEEQEMLIKSNTKEFSRLVNNIQSLKSAGYNQSSLCHFANTGSEAIRCLGILKNINAASAEAEVMTAKYFANNGLKDKAKELYRDVITTYAASAYASYTKQAEFGLEDLKGK